MRPGGGAVKGAEFERLVSKQLSRWCSDGERDDLYWRTAGSGSRGTLQKAANQLGDVSAIGHQGSYFTERCIVECKSYKRFDWPRFLFERTGEFHSFWVKLRSQCNEYHRFPLLFAKENNRLPLVVVDIFLIPALVGTPRLTSRAHGLGIYYMGEFLATPYSQFIKALKDIPYAAPSYHRPPPYRPTPARVPLKVPRLALRPMLQPA
jgi:hypothetical protein